MREGGLGGGVVGGGSGEKRDVDGGEVYIYIRAFIGWCVKRKKMRDFIRKYFDFEFRFERFTKKYKYVQNDQEKRNIVVSIASNKEFERRKRTNN